MPKRPTDKQKQKERIGRVTIKLDRHKSPFWQIAYSVSGRQVRRSLGTHKLTQARQLAERKHAELVMGCAAVPSDARATIEQVGQERRQRLKELGNSPKTIRSIEHHERQLMTFLQRGGRTRLSDLTSQVLVDFERTLRSKGVLVLTDTASGRRSKRKAQPLKPKTVRDTMKTIRGLIRYAVKNGLIDLDPAASYKLPPAPDSKITVFNPGELRQLFTDPEVGDLWRFYVHTCMRAEELIWLLIQDVILDEQNQPVAIHIRQKQCPQTERTWHPKHGQDRVVALSPEAAAIVAGAIATSKGPWLFESPDSRGEQRGKWTYGPLLRRLHAQLRAMGARRRGLHTFRHTGATHLANDPGVPIAQLKQLLGHKQLSMTQRYVHPTARDVGATLQQVDFARLTRTHDN